jgi:CHASE2 domain-containing sensor protein
MAVLARLRSSAFRSVWVGLACALVAWLAVQLPFLRGLDDGMLEGCFALRGQRSTNSHIVIIALDEPSLSQLRKSTNSLSPELAQVVRYARAQGATAIGIDVMIPADRAELEDLQPGQKGDALAMGQAVVQAGNVTLPVSKRDEGWLRPVPQWLLKAEHNPETSDLGFVNFQEDGDQVVRRQLLLGKEGERLLPQLALALYARSRGQDIEIDERGRPVIGDEVIPVDDEGLVRINYLGAPGSFETLSFAKVLKAEKDGEKLPQLEGAVVLVGVTARDQQDYHLTPYSGRRYGQMSGVELHANILATLDDRAFIRTPPRLLPLLLACGAVLGLGFAKLRPWASVLLAVVMALAWGGLCLAAFVVGHWNLGLAGLLLDGLLLCTSLVLARWLKGVPVAASFQLADGPGQAGNLPSQEPTRSLRVGTGTGSPLAATTTPEVSRERSFSPVGSVLSGYHVLEEVGRGGMGVVYRACQLSLNRVVALKMILAGPYAGPEERARFQREAEAVARLQHPNIVQVHEVGEHDGRAFMALEFVSGGSLAQRLRQGPLPVPDAVALVVTLARAVEHAHRRGVLHRDLKPANVLLLEDGTPKITDFGLARVMDAETTTTGTGVVVGTPGYMAPEQALGRSREIGPATDVYALGAILYQLLTGRVPFQADTIVETLDLVRFAAPQPPRELRPEVPPAVEAVCLRCLAKEPAQRYASADALAQALQEAHP